MSRQEKEKGYCQIEEVDDLEVVELENIHWRQPQKSLSEKWYGFLHSSNKLSGGRYVAKCNICEAVISG